MALTQKLQLRQSHALVMTPQLMQAIKLLQLSNLDLGAYVEGELERNPLLERVGEEEPGEREAPPEPDAAPAEWTADGADAAGERPASEPNDAPPEDSDAAASRANRATGQYSAAANRWPGGLRQRGERGACRRQQSAMAHGPDRAVV